MTRMIHKSIDRKLSGAPLETGRTALPRGDRKPPISRG